jgi:hypothetical protein
VCSRDFDPLATTSRREVLFIILRSPVEFLQHIRIVKCFGHNRGGIGIRDYRNILIFQIRRHAGFDWIRMKDIAYVNDVKTFAGKRKFMKWTFVYFIFLVLSVFRLTDYDYLFGIFKLFLVLTDLKSMWRAKPKTIVVSLHTFSDLWSGFPHEIFKECGFAWDSENNFERMWCLSNSFCIII